MIESCPGCPEQGILVGVIMVWTSGLTMQSSFACLTSCTRDAAAAGSTGTGGSEGQRSTLRGDCHRPACSMLMALSELDDVCNLVDRLLCPTKHLQSFCVYVFAQTSIMHIPQYPKCTLFDNSP